MKSFLSKYSFLVIWILVIIIVGALFILVVQPSLHFGSTQTLSPSVASATPTPVVPATPSVTLTIQKSKAGNTLLVQWQNLPANTTALDIFRGLKNSTSGWSLWQTLILTPGELTNGNALIALGKATLDGYSFYVEAVIGNGNGTNGGQGSGSNPTVLWTSSVSEPTVTTSTPTGTPGSTTPPEGTPTSSTPLPQPSSTPPASSSSAPTTNPPATPSGTPVYNPQVQIQSYGSPQTDNFWVEHIDQKIEIGWQNLPPETDSVVVLRSDSEYGPWVVVLSQQNSGVNTAYSIQLVDNTLGAPYYYEMNAVSESTTIATYGPVYLVGQ
jgi:hypothetical protein